MESWEFFKPSVVKGSELIYWKKCPYAVKKQKFKLNTNITCMY